MAIGVVYIVLGMLYESYIHPLTIFPACRRPVSGRCSRCGCSARAEHLLIRRFDHADRHREEERHHADRLRARGRAPAGKTPAEAIYEGCLIRFRPIMMTTMAALFGSLPIALGYGAGAKRGGRSASQSSAGCCLAALDALSDAGDLHLHGVDSSSRRASDST